MLTEVLDRTTLKMLNRFASNNDVNLNSLLLREMFLTLKDWNEAFGEMKENQWLRLGMPLNMRMHEHGNIPACNMVSIMFIPRTAEDCLDEEKLLLSIQTQTLKNLHNRLGNLVLAGIRRARKVPGLLGFVLKSKRPFATAMLANVGEMRKHFGAEFPHTQGKCIAGNVVIEQVNGVAPIRNGTRMSVSLGVYGREMVINMKCDPKYFSQSQSEDLLSLYVQRLRKLASEIQPGQVLRESFSQ